MAGIDDTPPSFIPWETLRDAYVSRFGPLVRAEPELDLRGLGLPREEGDWTEEPLEEPEPDVPLLTFEEVDAADVLFYELSFGALSARDPRHTHATFGAAPHTGGHEVFLVSAVPFDGFNGILEQLVVHHAPLSPGMVVPMKIWATPFEAVLLAPADAGSISFGRAGAAGEERFALRVVPLTYAEQQLAADSVERLTRALEKAGALQATDPLRDCVLVPGSTQRFWASFRPLLWKDVERRLRFRKRCLRQLVESGAPPQLTEGPERAVLHARLLREHLRAKRPDPESEAERRAARERRENEVMNRVFAATAELVKAGAVPQPILRVCGVVTCVTLMTHPTAQRLLFRALGKERGPAFKLELLLAETVRWMRRFLPDSDPARLLQAGRDGFDLAQEKAREDGPDAVAPPETVWDQVVFFMCNAALQGKGEQSLVMMLVAQCGLDAAKRELQDPGGGDPAEQLREASKRIVLAMVAWWKSSAFGRSPAGPAEERDPPESEPTAKKKRIYH